MTDNAFDLASAIASQYGGKPRKTGNDWRVFCPVHEKDGRHHTPSLAVWNRPSGVPTFACMTGCPHHDVREALHVARVAMPKTYRRLTPEERALEEDKVAAGIKRAGELFGEASLLRGHDPVTKYLWDRHLRVEHDELAFVRCGRGERPGAWNMLTALCDPMSLRDDMVRALGVIVLPMNANGIPMTDPRGKKLRGIIGRRRGGAVPIGTYKPGRPICIGEGFESTIAGMRMTHCDFGLASGGSSTLPLIALPEWADKIIIAADNDTPGLVAAGAAATTWRAEGRHVVVVKWGTNGCDPADEWKRLSTNSLVA